MLSRKAKYGVKALIYLAQKYGRGNVLIADLSQKERIPQKFLELILLELKHQGILQSKKGKGGGYLLGRAPSQIMVGHIVRILNGPLAPVSCVSQTAYQKCEECLDEHTCGIKSIMQEVRDAMANILDHTSLADLLKRSEKVEHQNTLNYQI